MQRIIVASTDKAGTVKVKYQAIEARK